MDLKSSVDNLTVSPAHIIAQLKPHLEKAVGDRHQDFYVKKQSAELFQGDLIRTPRTFSGIIGEEYALLISNSCDMVEGREKRLLLIPLKDLPAPEETEHSGSNLDQYRNIYRDVVSYQNTSYFFLPPTEVLDGVDSIPGLYGAFNEAISVGLDELYKEVKANPTVKLTSLADTGYYIFLLKLAVHFLRPDERFFNVGQ